MLAAAGFAVFLGGVHRISAVSAVIVPTMAGLYLVLGIIIVILNLGEVPAMASLIVSEAFTLKSVSGAALGVIITQGIKRGLFSNEAGIGSVPNAAATSSASHPAKQGLVQALGVYFDTLLVCSITGFIVLLSHPSYGTAAGAQLTQTALAEQLGPWAVHFLTVAIFFFAFSSIIGNYYYGQANLEFLTDSPRALLAYRIVVMVAVFAGAVIALETVWTAANIFMAVMAVINLAALVVLSRHVFTVLADYRRQRHSGAEPIFHQRDFPQIPGLTAWDGSDEVTTAEFWQRHRRR